MDAFIEESRYLSISAIKLLEYMIEEERISGSVWSLISKRI